MAQGLPHRTDDGHTRRPALTLAAANLVALKPPFGHRINADSVVSPQQGGVEGAR
jgi:hypothetical protein